jgi:phosphopantothenoylcysteine decarboxylase/phosphopantothenate--cysteine ligase
VNLQGKSIVLCVCGSIAAYKAADLASKLVQAGARVDVVLTLSAHQFVTPFTFRSLTGRPAYTDMFQPQTQVPEEHVALARQADLVIVAPATANTMAKLVYGFADDMVALTVLATKAPVLIAPAMNDQMWQAAATQANVAILKSRGVSFVGPDTGHLASGGSGPGRLAAPETVLGAAQALLARGGDLAGYGIVVSAGGTREPLDPVRYLSNYSSGKMGFALAEAARDRGARVSLVSTTTAPPLPYGVDLIEVETVAQMRDAVLSACEGVDALIMAAAVSDFRPAQVGEQKIKKSEGGLTLELVKNPDFLLELPDDIVKVGFAAETEDLLANARQKLIDKRLDLICANDVTAPDAGFGVDTNRVTIIDGAGQAEELPLLSKYETAMRILDRLAPLLSLKRAHNHRD